MKKLLFLLLIAVLMGDIAFAGDGTKENPYTVDDLIEAGAPASAVANVYVQGYIVGSVDGQVYNTGCNFGLTNASNTNIVIASTSLETDKDWAMPVQLPAGDVRNALSLQQNPDNLGHEVLLYGSWEKYFGVNGFRSVTSYEWIGEAPTPGGGGNSNDDDEWSAKDIIVTVDGNPVKNGSTVNSYRLDPVLVLFGAYKLDPEVLVSFSKDAEVSITVYNKTENLPQNIQFCWPTQCAVIASGSSATQVGPVQAHEEESLAIDVTLAPYVDFNFDEESVYTFYTTVEINYGADKPFVFDLNMIYDPNPSVPDVSNGTKENPYTVDDLIEAGAPASAVANVYVQGYIVGSVDGQVYNTGCNFGLTNASNTNILIASTSQESDKDWAMPVQLPAGDVRNALSLQQNPDNLGHEVLLYGSWEKYFGVNGFKSVTSYEWIGEAPTPGDPNGDNPGTIPTPNEPMGEKVTFNFTDPASLGIQTGDAIEVDLSGITLTEDVVSMTVISEESASSKARLFLDSKGVWSFRFYNNTNVAVSVPDGYTLTGIVFNGTNIGTSWSYSNGSLSGSTWTPSSTTNTVTIAKIANGNNPAITSINVYFAKTTVGEPVTGKSYYVIGSDVNGKNWALAQADSKMTETSIGVYEWTGTTLGSGFKINEGTWDGGWNIGNSGSKIQLDTPYNYYNGGDSGDIAFDGFDVVNNPKVVLNTNNGTILLTGELGEKEPVDPSDVTFYIIGSNVNGQSWALAQEDAKFTDEGNGIYRWEGKKLGTGFKINDGTWSNGDLNIGSTGAEITMNTPYYYWANGSSSNFAFDGFTTLNDPVVELNLNEETVTLVGGTPGGFTNWYVCGINGVYELTEEWMLSQVGDTNVFEREVYIVETAGKVKISDDGWAHQYGTNLPEENFIDPTNLMVYLDVVNGEGGDVDYELEEGAYIVSFDLDELTLTFKPNGLKEPDMSQFDKNSESGIYLGLISFNKNIYKLPFKLLTQTSVSDFYYFIQNMQMDNATLLYYAVDLGLSEISSYQKYPTDLSNILLITFTDGLDRGSLAYRPDFLTDKNYASYLADRILKTKVGNIKLQAYTIGLTGMEDQDEDMFMYNLQSLSYPTKNAHSVDDLEDVKNELINIYNEMSQQTVNRSISITVPIMSHGDICRFTMDGIRDKTNVGDSKIWIQGEFDIRTLSLTNIQYNGLSSVSGINIKGEQNGIYITFTFNDCRDTENNMLDILPEDIDQWFYLENNSWLHNTENINSNDIIIKDVKNSAAVMLLVDSSTSLGDSFQNLKETALSFIDKLLDKEPENTESIAGVKEDVDWSNAKTYNLQGIEVINPRQGIYIQLKDGKNRKILIR